MFIKIKEFNKENGVLVNYVKLQGNEEFIDKLKSTINKFPKILFTDYYIVIYDEVSDIKMEAIIYSHIHFKNPPYDINYNELDADNINNTSSELFIESFKNRKLFK